MDKLSTVNKIVYFPTEPLGQVYAKLLELSQCAQQIVMAAPFTLRDQDGSITKRLAVVCRAGGVMETVDITDLDPKLFFGRATQSTNAATTEELLSKLPKIGIKSEEYAFVIHNPCDTMSIPWNKGKFIVTVSEKKPTYFDLGFMATRGRQFDLINYSSRKALGGKITHSGDNNVGYHLIQYIELHTIPADGTNFVVLATGYTGSQLYQYENVLMMIIDETAKTIHVVPAPLDRATVREANGMMLLACTVDNGFVHCQVLDNPLTGTFEVTAPVSTLKPIAQMALNSAPAPVLTGPSLPSVPIQSATAVSATVASSSSKGKRVTTTIPAGTVCVILDAGAADSLCKFVRVDSRVALVGNSMVAMIKDDTGLVLDTNVHRPINVDEVIAESSTGSLFPIIPYIEKPMEGSRSLLLAGTYPELISGAGEYLCTGSRTGLPNLVLTSDQMLESVTSHQKGRLNGVCIISAAQTNLECNKKAIHDCLVKLNQAGAVSRMGPVSVILAALEFPETRQYFYLSGVPFSGLFADRNLKFADNVTKEIESRMSSWLYGELTDPFFAAFAVSTEFDPASDVVAWYAGGWVTAARVEKLFDVPIKHLIDNLSTIKLLLPQLRKSMSAVNLTALTDNLVKIIVNKASASQAKIRQTIKNRFANGYLTPGGIGQDAQYQRFVRNKKDINTLLGLIKGLTSEVGVYTQGFSLAQQERKLKIANNVADVKNMTSDDLQDFITDQCYSTLALAVNPTQLRLCYKAMGKEQFGQQFLAAAAQTDVLALTDTPFDTLTCCSLLDIAGDATGHPLAQTGSPSLAIVDWKTKVDSVLFLPLFTENYDQCLVSSELANDPIIAKLRILLRGSLVNTEAAFAELGGRSLPAYSREVGWFMVYIIQNTISSICDRLSSVPRVGPDTDNETCKIIRSLFWLLATTLASGSMPMSTAYHIFQPSCRPDLPRNDFEYCIYRTIAKYYRYMAPDAADKRFDLNKIESNLSRLLIRLLGKVIMGPFIKVLHNDSVVQKKSVKSAEWHSNRIKYLNEHYYPQYQALTKLADDAVNTPNDRSIKKLLDSLDTFFRRPENANRRARCGSIAYLIRYIKQRSHNNKNPQAQANCSQLIDAIQAKRDPANWKIPGPGDTPVPDKETVESQSAEPITHEALKLAVLACNMKGSKGAQLQNQQALLACTICVAPGNQLTAKVRLQSFCASFKGLPPMEWLVDMARGAGWGDTIDEILDTIQHVLERLSVYWKLGNDEVEKLVLNDLSTF